jgi:hypothetical protein
MPLIVVAAAAIASAAIASHGAHSAAETQAEAAKKAGASAQEAAYDANAIMSIETGKANDMISAALKNVGALNDKNLALLQPYIDAGGTTLGQIMSGLQPGGEFNTPFTADMMEQYDPGYAFRLEQGQKAIERSAAARGVQLTGGTLKDLVDYEQGAASSEYQNAFNRYMSQVQQSYNMLAGVTNLGVAATNSAVAGNQWLGANLLQGEEMKASNLVNTSYEQGRNTMQGATYNANQIVGAGNSIAAGQIASANAWSQAMTTIGNAAMQQYNMGNTSFSSMFQFPSSINYGSNVASNVSPSSIVYGPGGYQAPAMVAPPTVASPSFQSSSYGAAPVTSPWNTSYYLGPMMGAGGVQ